MHTAFRLLQYQSSVCKAPVTHFKAHAGIPGYPKFLQFMGFLPQSCSFIIITPYLGYASCFGPPPSFSLSLLKSLTLSPLMAKSSLLPMFSLLLSFPALDLSRSHWMFSPSHIYRKKFLHSNTLVQPYCQLI